MKKSDLTEDSKRFFRFWREQYEWPIGIGRKTSEEKIFELLNKTKNVILGGKSGSIQKLLVEIHQWKTNNQRGISKKYGEVLAKDTKVAPFLQSNFPLQSSTLSPTFFRKLLDTLKIRNCNLPICSAQASFLLNRKLPILDRFVAQFFSLTVSKHILDYSQFDMNDVLQDIHPIVFKIEDSGTGLCIPRLAVYQRLSYEKNRYLFINQLIPELIRIAELLNKEEVKYEDIHGITRDFSCVDVEMAVFAFATKNRHHFECFYDKSPTKLSF